jgi:hypothetical protein
MPEVMTLRRQDAEVLGKRAFRSLQLTPASRIV